MALIRSGTGFGRGQNLYLDPGLVHNHEVARGKGLGASWTPSLSRGQQLRQSWNPPLGWPPLPGRGKSTQPGSPWLVSGWTGVAGRRPVVLALRW